ncbi:hypothetical protein [Acrocarpospora phusangensis]|nr:hypothetical protein [Acrocarpospora phusangensis]
MTMMFALASAPAQAASSVEITHRITVPGQVRHQIDVHLPMNQEDAAGYIWNGARIQVTCYGDDWFDDPISGVPVPGFTGPGTYRGRPAPGQPGEQKVLTATSTGVHLTIVNFYEKGRQLNEDILPSDDDEVYCKARWIDGDGYVLTDTSNTVRGKF